MKQSGSRTEHPAQSGRGGSSALRDPQQRYVQATGMLLLCVAVVFSFGAALMHIEQPRTHPLNQIVPTLMGIAFSALLLRYWLRPAYLLSTIWLGWMTGIFGLATPVWWFVIEAWDSPLRLIDTLPPVTPLLLPLLLIMAIFARPHFALQAGGTGDTRIFRTRRKPNPTPELAQIYAVRALAFSAMSKSGVR